MKKTSRGAVKKQGDNVTTLRSRSRLIGKRSRSTSQNENVHPLGESHTVLQAN